MEVEGELCDNDLHVAVRLSDVDATLSALNEGDAIAQLFLSSLNLVK